MRSRWTGPVPRSPGAAAHYGTNPWPQGVTTADLNGDGKQDLVTSSAINSTISVLLGRFELRAGTMRVSSGATATDSRTVVVDAAVAEATEVRLRNEDAAWGEWTFYVHASIWNLPACDGVKTVEAQYGNSLGATEVPTDSILLDAVAPLTTDDSSGWARTSPATVALSASDVGSGVAKTQYKVDGATNWSEGTIDRCWR